MRIEIHVATVEGLDAARSKALEAAQDGDEVVVIVGGQPTAPVDASALQPMIQAVGTKRRQ